MEEGWSHICEIICSLKKQPIISSFHLPQDAKSHLDSLTGAEILTMPLHPILSIAVIRQACIAIDQKTLDKFRNDFEIDLMHYQHNKYSPFTNGGQELANQNYKNNPFVKISKDSLEILLTSGFPRLFRFRLSFVSAQVIDETINDNSSKNVAKYGAISDFSTNTIWSLEIERMLSEEEYERYFHYSPAYTDLLVKYQLYFAEKQKLVKLASKLLRSESQKMSGFRQKQMANQNKNSKINLSPDGKNEASFHTDDESKDEQDQYYDALEPPDSFTINLNFNY